MIKYYTPQYRCRVCLELFERAADATPSRHLCRSESTASCTASPTAIYECGDCGVRHTSLEDVKECCQAADKATMPKLLYFDHEICFAIKR